MGVPTLDTTFNNSNGVNTVSLFTKTSEFEYELVILTILQISCTVQVVHRNLNPVWQERFQFIVEDASQDMLMAKVWDHDTFGRVKSLL